MLTEILVSICALVFLYLSYKYAVDRPKNFPPGPPRVPWFGSYLFMLLINYKHTHKAVLRMARLYKSDIIGFHMGPYPVVAVHNAEGVRAILNNSDFDGRPKIFLAAMRDPDLQIQGIFFNDGPQWHEQRRFILRYLRDYGFGRRFDELEGVIAEELNDMMDLIRKGPQHEHEFQMVKPGGHRVQFPTVMSPFVINSFFHVMMNERLPRAEQAELVKLAKMAFQFSRNGDDYGRLLSIMPWLRKVFPNLCGYNTLMEANRFMHQFFANLVDRQIASYEEGQERHFIDHYIKELRAASEKGKDSKLTEEMSSFQRGQFIMGMLDFTLPVMTSVTSQFVFLVQHMLRAQELQKRIQREIDEVIGDSRLPTLDDRQHMHYTEAAIRECLRLETLVPSDVPHRALVDTELLGYKIPKDTIVVPSLYAYHSDKRVWGEDAKDFRAERFLDDRGELSLKKDVSFPFGAGKRLCAGETFARNMLFLLLTTLCQNFNFVLGPGDKVPDLSKNLTGIIITPPDFWVQMEERH